MNESIPDRSKDIIAPVPVVRADDDPEQGSQWQRRALRGAAGLALVAATLGIGAEGYKKVQDYLGEGTQLVDVTGIVDGITGERSDR